VYQYDVAASVSCHIFRSMCLDVQMYKAKPAIQTTIFLSRQQTCFYLIPLLFVGGLKLAIAFKLEFTQPVELSQLIPIRSVIN